VLQAVVLPDHAVFSVTRLGLVGNLLAMTAGKVPLAQVQNAHPFVALWANEPATKPTKMTGSLCQAYPV
jgi:hypothetical protein